MRTEPTTPLAAALARAEAAEAREKALRSAMAFYADRDNHAVRLAGEVLTPMKKDMGEIARAALGDTQ